jgi:hypothetical protein
MIYWTKTNKERYIEEKWVGTARTIHANRLLKRRAG